MSMETTIIPSPLVAASFIAVLPLAVVVILCVVLSIKTSRTWTEKAQARLLGVALVSVIAAALLMITGMVMVGNQSREAVAALESEYGITDLTPLGQSMVGGCSMNSAADAAEYTWVTKEGQRERGIFARAERQDGQCVYSLTPESAS